MTAVSLIFLGREGGFEGWLRLEEGEGTARGQGFPHASDGARIAAIVPGDSVTLYWLDLPAGLAPAQAAAAARLAAAEHSAQPSGELHVAIGPAGGEDGLRCVGLVSATVMAEWMARLAEAGLDPDLVVPETLLLPRGADGFTRYERGTLSLCRGATEAFAAEPDLADLVLAGRPVTLIDGDAFEAGLAEAVANPALDLRQGLFARRPSWQVDRTLVRRLALLVLLILVATLAIQVAAILRYTYAADALEAEARTVAAAALPRATGIGEASADLDARLAELRGGGIGFTAIAAPVFAAIRDTANAEMAALAFNPDGSLRVTVQADTPATISAVVGRIEAAGLAVEGGVLRSGGGRQISDLMVRPR
ncbi:MAG TPA: type II secretion system protein GspL [Allosphingosinicella sp.]|nr:type II secretion system protein GspL [Allosphingosinicella sp.]